MEVVLTKYNKLVRFDEHGILDIYDPDSIVESHVEDYRNHYKDFSISKLTHYYTGKGRIIYNPELPLDYASVEIKEAIDKCRAGKTLSVRAHASLSWNVVGSIFIDDLEVCGKTTWESSDKIEHNFWYFIRAMCKFISGYDYIVNTLELTEEQIPVSLLNEYKRQVTVTDGPELLDIGKREDD